MIAIYLAGPITHGNPKQNVQRAFEVCNDLLDIGVAVFCPHHSYCLDQMKSRPYEDWMAIDAKWISVCDALYRMPGYSPGADREEDLAFQMGKPIFKSIDEVKKWLQLN